MKQTSVEWLVEQVEQISNNKNLSKQESIDLYNKAIEQANNMFKQQIIDAYEKGDKYKLEIPGEEYYNETFKK
jgi:hypothetical protein